MQIWTLTRAKKIKDKTNHFGWNQEMIRVHESKLFITFCVFGNKCKNDEGDTRYASFKLGRNPGNNEGIWYRESTCLHWHWLTRLGSQKNIPFFHFPLNKVFILMPNAKKSDLMTSFFSDFSFRRFKSYSVPDPLFNISSEFNLESGNCKLSLVSCCTGWCYVRLWVNVLLFAFIKMCVDQTVNPFGEVVFS